MFRKLLVFSLVWALVACAVNPITGEREITLVSDQQAIAIGQQQYQPAQQMQGGALTVDPALQAYVQRVGSRLGVASGVDLPYEFVVLNNSSLNAWALPGGKIAINRGLLVTLQNEAELAAVLAHEVAHAAARHGAKRMERGLLTQGLITAAGLSLAGLDYGNEVVGIATQGAELLNLKYSRNAEREADFYGIDFMVKAGYDPYAAVTLQEKFLALAGDAPAGIAGWFASHPPSAERVANNRQRVKQLRNEGVTGGRFNQAEYAQATAMLTRNKAAYALFDEATVLFGEKSYDAANSTIGQAISKFAEEPQFHGMRGAIRLAQQRYDDALVNLDRALQRDSGYFLYYLHRGVANARLGRHANAKQDLEGSVSLLPTSAAYMSLGEVAEATGEAEAAKRYYEQAAKSGGSSGEQARARYVALDVSDQPARYVQAQLSADAGQALVVVANRAGVELQDVIVQVEARTAAGVQRDTVRIERLPVQGAVSAKVAIAMPVLESRAYAVSAKVR